MNRLTFSRFKGLNNVLNTRGLHKEFFVRAENVFMSNDFQLVPANSFEQVVNTIGVNALWASQGVCLVVVNSKLYRLVGDTLIDLNYTVSPPLAFCMVDTFVYFCSYYGNGKLNKTTNTITAWGLPNPTPPVVETVGGSLQEATYLIAVTIQDHTGLESGSSNIVAVTGTGFTIKVLDTAYKHNIYVSSPNGKELKLAGSLQPHETVFEFTSPISSFGATLQTRGLLNPPYGNSLEFFMGRLFIGCYDILYFTEPFKFDYVAPTNFISFETQIKYLTATETNLFVATYDGLYSISREMVLNRLKEGNVCGLGKVFVGGKAVMAIFDDGIYLVSGEGMKNVTKDVFKPDFYTSKILEDENYIYIIGG